MKPLITFLRPVLFLTALTAMGAQVPRESVVLSPSKPQEPQPPAEVLPSEWTVLVSDGDNGNSKVTLRGKHLPPPAKVAADSTVYVVWIQPQEGDLQNVGTLTLTWDFQGSLDTLTPHRSFKLLVTPEPAGQGASPTHEPVFTYNVESNK